MIVTNNQAAGSNPVVDGVQLRQHNAQLRRADSNKSGPSAANNAASTSAIIANNLNSPMMNANRPGKPRPSQFQHNVTSNSASASSPALLHSVSATGSVPIGQQSLSANNGDELLPNTFHFICSRYLLFVVYVLLLLSLILNTFLHFLIYGSSMSICALFLDVHHRYELVVGEYYSLNPQATAIYLSRDNWVPPNSAHRPNLDMIHCDRDSFLSLLDEFYHHPKSSLDSSFNSESTQNINDQLFNRAPGRSKSYPKIFTNFNKDKSQKPSASSEEEQLYYSSSSTSTNSHIDSARRMAETQWQMQKRNEYRVLVIEVTALILLFILVVTQLFGLVAVIRMHHILLIFVTAVNSILFCLLVYVSSFGLLTLLLLAIALGFWFILQLKFGVKKCLQKQHRLKEDMGNEMREIITQTGARMSPCIHVSMEQYEAMTQQMMHRYSSPIVYCPHYNESLC